MNAFPKNKPLSLGVMIIFLLSLTTCEKEPTKPTPVAPEVPPVQSLQMDISFFKTSPNYVLHKTSLAKQNFIAAATRIAVIDTPVMLASVATSALLAASLNQQPILKEDGKWHWIFTIQQGSQTFSVDLTGWNDTPQAEVVWEIYISVNTDTSNLSHFLWYHGRSKIGNKEGWWVFNDVSSPKSLAECLKVDWEIPDENESKLIFTNVKAASQEYGNYLKYGNELTDRFLIYFNDAEGRANTIYWNAETKAGYIEWFDYNNGVKSYWDENLKDITSPPA